MQNVLGGMHTETMRHFNLYFIDLISCLLIMLLIYVLKGERHSILLFPSNHCYLVILSQCVFITKQLYEMHVCKKLNTCTGYIAKRIDMRVRLSMYKRYIKDI